MTATRLPLPSETLTMLLSFSLAFLCLIAFVAIGHVSGFFHVLGEMHDRGQL